MPNRFMTMIVTITSIALLNVAMPEPVMLDLLGAGLASLGLSLIYDGGVSF